MPSLIEPLIRHAAGGCSPARRDLSRQHESPRVLSQRSWTSHGPFCSRRRTPRSAEWLGFVLSREVFMGQWRNSVQTMLLSSCLLVFAGCAPSRMSTTRATGPTHPVRSIAMAPSGGVVADAIAVELFNRGFQVYDTAQTSNLLIRTNLTEIEVMQPQNLARLKEQGIDAMLIARGVAGRDEKPQSASVRVSSTHTGAIIAGLSWQNGWSGEPNSIADRTMRKDLSEAAAEIAEELSVRLGGP